MNSHLDKDNVVAKRQLQLILPNEATPQLVNFLISKPAFNNDEWFCTFEIQGLQEPQTGAAYGSDSVQALLLAMAKVRVILLTYALDMSASFRFEGRPGIGLPSLLDTAEPERAFSATDTPPSSTKDSANPPVQTAAL